jgi:hypothetical protein
MHCTAAEKRELGVWQRKAIHFHDHHYPSSGRC